MKPARGEIQGSRLSAPTTSPWKKLQGLGVSYMVLLLPSWSFESAQPPHSPAVTFRSSNRTHFAWCMSTMFAWPTDPASRRIVMEILRILSRMAKSDDHDALDVLRQDHAAVAGLFDRYEGLDDDDH